MKDDGEVVAVVAAGAVTDAAAVEVTDGGDNRLWLTGEAARVEGVDA